MKIKRHHFFTLVLTISMMLIALALLFINDWLSKHIDPKVNVREVKIVSLPPPPPPQIQQEQAPQQSITLNLEGDGAAMAISLIKVEQPKIELTAPPLTRQVNIDFSDALNIDWQAFGLDELDSVPTILTRAKSTYPKALVKQGILHVTVKLEVFISESGKPTLIAIRGKYHKALTIPIAELVKRARFSPPTKDGIPVTARFVWPVEFKKT